MVNEFDKITAETARKMADNYKVALNAIHNQIREYAYNNRIKFLWDLTDVSQATVNAVIKDLNDNGFKTEILKEENLLSITW